MSETKESFTIHHGDCLEVLRSLPDCSVDSVVSDPPYGLSFMGKKWDYDVPAVEVWQECLRVLKPGGHLLAFAGTRTQHRMAVRIEDAGFEIRDMIAWVYGSGFPKSLDVSKAIDKAAGAEREVVGEYDRRGQHDGCNRKSDSGGEHEMRAHVEAKVLITAPATDAARQWQGWGTALKPALEPITLARKPLENTVAENVLEHGTGGLNIDGCRVENPDYNQAAVQRCKTAQSGDTVTLNIPGHEQPTYNEGGRWPANLIHDGSEEVTELFPDSKTKRIEKPCHEPEITGHKWGTMQGNRGARGYDGEGSAARFFYCAKASKKDRNEGLEGFAKVTTSDGRAVAADNAYQRGKTERNNFHPTVKPTDLMRYLCRLVTCPGGVVLDPFTGSGSTGKAAVLEGFRFIGIEREAEYVQIARARISAVQQEKPEPDLLLI